MLLRSAIQNFDIAAYVMNHGAEPGKDEEWVMDCPLCGKHKLCVNIERRTWHCWVCEQYTVGTDGKRRPVSGAGGVLDLIELMEGVQRERAIDMVMSGAIFAHVDIGMLPAESIADDVMRSFRTAVPIPGPESWKPVTGILPFCVKRGITEDDVQTFGLGWCDAGRCKGRLIFPIWEEGQFVYYQARAMWQPHPGENHIKALNPPATPGAAVSSEVLMNLDVAKHYPRVAVVEGPTDLVRTGPDAVCTFGKQIHPAQIAKLLRAGVRALDLMWDGPSPSEPRGAWDEMAAVAPLLSALFDLRLVWLPQGDPGEYQRDHLNWFRHHAQPAASVSRISTV
jgi:hypothetical protein